MHKVFCFIVAVTLAAGCATTNRPPAFRSAGIAPNRLHPGDAAVISVDIHDRFGIVQRVEGKVKEDPTLDFKLKDDGAPPDEKANDGIWTLRVTVPFNAPPGDFEFSLTAYDASGQPVLVRDKNGDVMPLSANFGLVIQIPPQP